MLALLLLIVGDPVQVPQPSASVCFDGQCIVEPPMPRSFVIFFAPESAKLDRESERYLDEFVAEARFFNYFVPAICYVSEAGRVLDERRIDLIRKRLLKANLSPPNVRLGAGLGGDDCRSAGLRPDGKGGTVMGYQLDMHPKKQAAPSGAED